MSTSPAEHQTFALLVNEQFDLQLPSGEHLPAELLEARSLNGAGLAGSRAPFALLFKGPATPVLPQQIYSLAHPKLQSLDIFLVPVASRSDGMRYEALFN